VGQQVSLKNLIYERLFRLAFDVYQQAGHC